MNIKKYLYLFIFGLILFGISNSVFAVSAQKKYYGQITMGGSIFKTNDHGDGLTGAKFKISDIHNTFSYYAEDEGNGIYGLGYFGGNTIPKREDSNITYNTIMSMLPTCYQNDLRNYIDTGDTSNLNDAYHVGSSYVEFLVPLVIEEVTAPSGYVKGEKIVYPVIGTISRDGLKITLTLLFRYSSMYLKYNNDVNYDNFTSYMMSQSFGRDAVDCDNLGFHSNALDNANLGYTPLILFNEKGNVSLKISNYVNNLEKYTTTRGKVLKYRIEVENTGVGISHDNIIITTIPNELEYVVGSASDGGIYNKNNQTITWKVDSIGSKEKISFRYSARVPKDVPVGANFIGKSSVTSGEIGKIESRETTVSLINNPKTAAPIAVIVILVSMMGVMRVIRNHTKEKELDV